MQSTERGRRLNTAVVSTGKAVVQTGKAVGKVREHFYSFNTLLKCSWEH